MKTNYAEQLAWFEYSVKPYSITSSNTPTYCWHATKHRRPRPFTQQSQTEKGTTATVKDEVTSRSRKRKRIEPSESPFLTTMEDAIIIEDDEDQDVDMSDAKDVSFFCLFDFSKLGFIVMI